MGFVPQSDFILAVVPQSENNLGINPQNGLGINPQTGLGINPHVNLAVILVPRSEMLRAVVVLSFSVHHSNEETPISKMEIVSTTTQYFCRHISSKNFAQNDTF